jgi:putative addiction module killer protein
MKKYRILLDPEFKDWLLLRAKKERLQIQERLDLIVTEGHFGDHKSVTDDDSVWELRWVNGRRVYYSYLPKTKIVVLLGGNKNGQKKDIAQASNILSKRRDC